jgi:hypothetical protein
MMVVVLSLRGQASTTGLDCINLSLRPRHPSETGGKFISVEEFALLGSDRAEGTARVAPNYAVCERRASGAVQWAMLLGLCTIGGKGVRELWCWGSGVHAGSVVDGGYITKQSESRNGLIPEH